jgi:hypothetical protein
LYSRACLIAVQGASRSLSCFQFGEQLAALAKIDRRIEFDLAPGGDDSQTISDVGACRKQTSVSKNSSKRCRSSKDLSWITGA